MVVSLSDLSDAKCKLLFEMKSTGNDLVRLSFTAWHWYGD